MNDKRRVLALDLVPHKMLSKQSQNSAHPDAETDPRQGVAKFGFTQDCFRG